MLDGLSRSYPSGAPAPDTVTAEIAAWAARYAEFGPFNALLSDGERLYAHCSTRLAYIERRAPFTKAHLVDADVEVDFSQVTTPADRVAVIATVPLTDNEQWTTLAPGELAVFREGERVPV